MFTYIFFQFSTSYISKGTRDITLIFPLPITVYRDTVHETVSYKLLKNIEDEKWKLFYMKSKWPIFLMKFWYERIL